MASRATAFTREEEKNSQFKDQIRFRQLMDMTSYRDLVLRSMVLSMPTLGILYGVILEFLIEQQFQ